MEKECFLLQIGGGQLQAISATSLKSLWISESVGGQTISPITYKDGYLYTGTWNSKTTAGTYFCLSVTDEDPAREDEIKYCTWKYNHKGRILLGRCLRIPVTILYSDQIMELQIKPVKRSILIPLFCILSIPIPWNAFG